MDETDKRLYLVEQHLKEIQKDISNISSALVGNKENGNRGFIHELKDLKQDVINITTELSEIKLDLSKKDLYISKLEYFGTFVIGAFIASIVTLIVK